MGPVPSPMLGFFAYLIANRFMIKTNVIARLLVLDTNLHNFGTGKPSEDFRHSFPSCYLCFKDC